MLKKDTTNIYF